MTELFNDRIVGRISTKLCSYKSNDALKNLYQWSIEEPLKTLSEALPEHYKSLTAEFVGESGPLEKSLILRQKIKAIKEEDFNIKLSRWIIEDWGGITTGNDKDGENLKKCVEQADKQSLVQSEKKIFDFNRIASWSKHLAFKYPEKYAIYDARVIYSLNWLLFQKKIGAVQYFPVPSGRNSVMDLLDYRMFLFIDHYKVDEVRNRLNADIVERGKKPGGKSYFANRLNNNLFIKPSFAFSEYCNLLKRIAQKLYPDGQDGLALTKTEMILFSLADKVIAQEVLEEFATRFAPT